MINKIRTLIHIFLFPNQLWIDYFPFFFCRQLFFKLYTKSGVVSNYFSQGVDFVDKSQKIIDTMDFIWYHIFVSIRGQLKN